MEEIAYLRISTSILTGRGYWEGGNGYMYVRELDLKLAGPMAQNPEFLRSLSQAEV